jgi:DNA-binding transcriptional MerR regulator
VARGARPRAPPHLADARDCADTARVTTDPLLALREYRQLAPWNLRDLAATTTAILERARVRPVGVTARADVSERAVRFYVTRGMLQAPDGRGPAATYSYRHLLQLLTIKLRQMEGATLEAIARELQEATGDVLERRLAASLGDRLPHPQELGVADAGRAFHIETAPTRSTGPETWRHVAVDAGVELQLRATHPLASLPSQVIAGEIRAALDRLTARRAD